MDLKSIDELAVSVESGFSCSKSKLVESGLPHIRPFNIKPAGELSFEEVYHAPPEMAPKGKRELKIGDILFNNTNSVELVGKSAHVNRDYTAGFSNHITRIRINPDKCMPEYVAIYLNKIFNEGFFKANCTQWVSQAGFNADALKILKIPIPTIEKQQRVVEIFHHISSVYKLKTSANNKINQLIPSVFVGMFGDPVTNPMNWPVKNFGSLGDLDRGRSRHRPRNDPLLLNGPYPLIQTGDVANADWEINNFDETYSEIGLAQSKLWRRGTLCITIAANIAETAVLGFDACFPDSVVGFNPGSKVKSSYIQCFLGFLQPYLEKNAPQAAQKNINLNILREIMVPLPPIELQEQFDQYVNRILVFKSLSNTTIEKMDGIRNSCFSKLITQ